MALRYYDASSAIRTITPKDTFKSDYDAICEQIFDNTYNVYYNEIMYEEHYGEKDFVEIPMVRVDSVVNYNTGVQVGDDYKVFILTPDFPVNPYYGMKFKWGDNYWLVINTNNLGNMATSCEVRRCNNILRFFDKNGNKVYEPCILDQVLRFTNNNDSMTIVTGKAEQYIWCQRNDRTIVLKPNDRMLFGVPEQRIGFRLYAGGFGNSLNTITGDDKSPTLTQFYVEEYEIDYENDDIVEGFANAAKYRFNIDVSNNNTTFDVGAIYNLNATVYNNGNVINKEVIWTSENEDIASIENNKLKALSVGETTIKVMLKENNTIENSINIIVQESLDDVYDILIEPNVDYILQNSEKIFDVSLYKNGEKIEGNIEIKDISLSVPRNNYEMRIENNSFILKNKKVYMEEPIKVQCSTDEITKVFEIRLRGVY